MLQNEFSLLFSHVAFHRKLTSTGGERCNNFKKPLKENQRKSLTLAPFITPSISQPLDFL